MQNFADTSENFTPEHALAIDILAWLADDPELLGRFSALTGVDLHALRAFSEGPGFEQAMIGFIAGHEPTLMAFCRERDIAPETISHAWQKLEYNGQTE